MNLQEQLALAVSEGRKALEAGDLEKGKEWRQKAEAAKAALSELDALNGLAPAAPMRPPLPGAGDGVAPAQPAADPSVKAAYTMRFGEPDKAVEAILIDLHGQDYAQKYWDQRRAFNYYLRSDPQRPVPSWVDGAMKEIIFTPATVKDALLQGQDVAGLKTVMVEGSDTLGGYLVPVDFQTGVIRRLAGLTVVRPRARKLGTSRDAVELPKMTGGTSQYRGAVRITWVDETPTAGAAATNLTFGLERVPVHTAMAETFLSRNLIEDSAFPIESWLTEEFASASAIDEDNLFLTGDGNGKPQGILPGEANGLSLTHAASGSASAVTWDGLISTTFQLDAQYRQNAVWIGEKATYEDIALLKDGDGQYLWREVWGNNASEGGAGRNRTLLGYPALEQEGMPSVGSGAFPLIFGDLSGYTIVDRVGMSVERYIDSSTARINQVCYVMRRRLGGQLTATWAVVLNECAAS